MLAINNLLSSFMITMRSKAYRTSTEDKILIGFGFIGTAIGVFLLKKIDAYHLKIALAATFALMSVSYLFGYRIPIRNLKRASVIWGFITGIMSGSYSISGPPLTLFLTSKNVSNTEFRNLFALFNVFIPLISVGMFAALGMITIKTLYLIAASIPMLYLGVYIGKGFTGIKTETFRKIVIIISLIASILLLF